MTKQGIGIGPLTVMILILILLPPLHSLFGVAHAQDGSDHLDATGKIGGIFLRPGVRDEYKSSADMAWSHTLDTLRGIQGGDTQRDEIISRYQDYAILASRESDSIGDFQFDIWIVEAISDFRIYLPSNFTFAYSSSGYGTSTNLDKVYSVWTDITNDYSYITVQTLPEDEPIAPGWDRIEIGRMPSPTSSTSSFTMPSLQIAPGLYHIRLFQIRAPLTAGLYHIKIYVDGQSIGEGNFPIVIVKSSLEPAYVTGLVGLRELTPPTMASGRITAVGVTDPGGYAEAIAYFGPRDFDAADDRASYYRYWLFGLPAGTFELTASASGFLKASTRLTVNLGQSLTLPNFELEKGSEVRVKIWSKDENGPIPWGNLWQPPYGTNDPTLPIDDNGPHRDIVIRLLGQYDQPLGYWASDDIHAPYGPPWSPDTVDRNRNYPPPVLKPSTLPSSATYTTALNDSRGLFSIRLDGHVPADAADFIEGIEPGPYKLEFQVTGYVMREADDWQRMFTITSSAKGSTYAVEADLKRSGWITATAVIPRDVPSPTSDSTIAVIAKSTDGTEKGVAVGIFPAGAKEYTMILEGFNGLYNKLRGGTDYQDYGLDPIDYILDLYTADVGRPSIGKPGVGWYIVQDPKPELRINIGTHSAPAVFHIKPSSIELTLRSVRIGDPVQPSPWMFPGAGIRVLLIDELGKVAATLDTAFYGLVQDDGTIANDPYDVDTADVGRHGLLRVLLTGADLGPVSALGGFYPTRIDEGKYYVRVATFGYIQREDYETYVTPGAGTDLQVDLVQGSQIRVNLLFTHAGESTPFNGFVRVEVYDQSDNLVGASIYAGASANPNLPYLPYDASNDWKLVLGAAEGAGTELEPQRAFFSGLNYGVPMAPWANWPATTPSDANRLSVPQNATVAFDVFGFYSYFGDPDSRMDNLWANGWDTTDGNGHLDYGIRGSGDALGLEGSGKYTVRVWAFDPYGPDGVFDSSGPDGVFGTEDDYTGRDMVDGGLSDFRAYAQVNDATDIDAPWGGAVTVYVTLEDQPSLLGVVSWVDMHGDRRTLAWAQVIENSSGSIWTSSLAGSYKLWLPEGPHDFFVTTIGEERLWEPFYFDITLARSANAFREADLTTASRPIPEFADVTLVPIMSLAAVLIMLAKRRSKSGRS